MNTFETPSEFRAAFDALLAAHARASCACTITT